MNSDNNIYFSRGFFRSSGKESFTWISLYWNFFKWKPQLWIYYINSWLKYKPHQIFDINDLRNILSYILNPKWTYFFNNISINWDFEITISNNWRWYIFILSESEVSVFKNYLLYCINYIKNYKLIYKIDQLNECLENKISEHLRLKEKITISWYNNSIYNSNLIKDSLWNYNKIFIPTIEQEFHTQNKWIKTWYYFKFFWNNIWSIRINDKEVKYSWDKYPIQIIVQESWKNSTLITLSEEQFLQLKLFIKRIISNDDIMESNNIKINSSFSLTMKNTFNNKEYLNKDEISEDLYNQLVWLKELWNLKEIEKILKVLKINNKLTSNKYISIDTVKTLELEKNIFRNFSIANSNDDWVDKDSWIFQIWNINGSKSCTINIIKWDINNWWIQFNSSAITENDLYLFDYKLDKCSNLLNNPFLVNLTSMYLNLETVRLLNYKYWDLDCNELQNIIKWMIQSISDTKFLKSFNLNNGNSELSITGFIPNIFRQLNTNIFTLKAGIMSIQEERYPLTLKVNSNGNKILYFVLKISEVLELKRKMDLGDSFSLLARNWKFKKIFIKNIWDKIKLSYNVSYSNNNIDTVKPEFEDLYDLKEFKNIVNSIYEQIQLDIKTLLYKAIIYSSNKIIYDN